MDNVFLFEIDSTAGYYPKYAKDSILNTNDNFDYGEFQKMEDLIVNQNVTMTAFMYTFKEPGTYVFVNARTN